MRHTLTKADIAAIRSATTFAIHLSSNFPDGLVRAIKETRPSERHPFAQNAEYVIPAPVSRRRSQQADNIGTNFAYFGNYDRSHQRSILSTLKVGDEIAVEFSPDGYGSPVSARAHLYVDVLNLYVYRKAGKQTRILEFALDFCVCAPNEARMCQGVPYSESQQRYADGREHASAA